MKNVELTQEELDYMLEILYKRQEEMIKEKKLDSDKKQEESEEFKLNRSLRFKLER